ncbi:hypothetical protein YB2330_004297 [Saitoella coloradoensis]
MLISPLLVISLAITALANPAQVRRQAASVATSVESAIDSAASSVAAATTVSPSGDLSLASDFTLMADPTFTSLFVELLGDFTGSEQVVPTSGATIPDYCSNLATLDVYLIEVIQACSTDAAFTGTATPTSADFCVSAAFDYPAVQLALDACASPALFNDTAVATSYLSQFWTEFCGLYGAGVVEGSPTGYSFDCEATTTDDTGTTAAAATSAAASSAAAMTT